METSWQKNWKSSQKYPALDKNIETEVVIVGGGITGITAAYLLSKAGKKVVVLEKGTLEANSYTAFTTAMITAQIDTDFPDLVKIFGSSQARSVWQAGTEAIDVIEEIIKKEKIDCEFMRVPLFAYGNNEKEWEGVEAEGKAAQKAGFNMAVKPKNDAKIDKELPLPNSGYYIFKNQAKFHPLKYCDGLRIAAEKLGAVFYENTEATKIEGAKKVTVQTKDATVTGDTVIVATYEPFNKPKELFASKGMYVTYMCELAVTSGVLPDALYVDGSNPYHYFRVDGERVLIGGADHRQEIKMDPNKNYNELIEYADKIFGKESYSIVNKWQGGILESLDGLPLIGAYSREFPNRLVATAFSGNGMTYSMIAAKILTDKINNIASPYAKIFDPKRHFSATSLYHKGMDYVGELFHGALTNIFKNSTLKRRTKSDKK